MDTSPHKSQVSAKSKKSPNKRNQTSTLQDQIEQKDLLQGITEKEVEIEHLKTILVSLDQKVKVIDSVRDDLLQEQQLLKDSEEKRQELQNQLYQTAQDIEKMNLNNKRLQDTLIQENKKMQDEMDKVKEEKFQLEKELGQKNITIQLLTEQNLQLQTELLKQQQLVKLKEDVDRQLKIKTESYNKLFEQKQRIQKDLETASDYLLEQEEKTYKANKTSLDLLKQLKDSELEIETLKNYIIDLKQRIAVYIPIKDDPVDKKLAEFINNYPERSKLKIMFMRESEGVYQFGTKRVYVRVDKDKINIRVGGGYLAIDEFLDQYTPQELDKMERKDPLKKFSEKVAIQKTIVGKELREQSPIRQHSPDRSKMKQ